MSTVQPSDLKGAQGGVGLLLRSPGGWVQHRGEQMGCWQALQRTHGRGGEQSKAGLWQNLQPWQGAECSSVSGKLLSLVFLAPLSSLGSSVLTFVFPFGLSFSLQMCCVLQPWETPLCLK